jgi:hypothetical protein
MPLPSLSLKQKKIINDYPVSKEDRVVQLYIETMERMEVVEIQEAVTSDTESLTQTNPFASYKTARAKQQDRDLCKTLVVSVVIVALLIVGIVVFLSILLSK